MKKALFLLVAGMFPTLLCAQALNQALQQLEQMTGQTIDDVYIPDPGDPVPVDPDPEEEPQQSTHLKDYTPAQEQEETHKKSNQEIIEDYRRSWEAFQREQEERAKIYRTRDARISREHEAYNTFLESQPQVQSVPVFSSIDERKILFPEPKSLYELNDFCNFKVTEKDSAYKADIILYSSRHSLPAYFLGRRLENGRIEWRVFINEFGEYEENLSYCGFYSDFDCSKIKDVRLYGEGRVILMEMYDGTSYVMNPHGTLICHGRNISFPAMSGDVLFIECDGGLHASNAPYNQPIIRGEHLDYYRNSVIVTNHFSSGKTYYQLYSYGGRAYDWKENAWPKYAGFATFDYIAPFSNEGDYYVLKPQGKKDYFIVSFNKGQLYRGKKKYKTIEEAHAAWQKEKAYIIDTWRRHPEKCAKIDKR